MQRGRGRPKGATNLATRDVKEAAREYTDDAIRTLARIMRRGETEQARVAAAKELLDRGYGKATQHIEANVNVIDQLSHEDKRALLEALAALPGGEEPADEPASTRH